MSYLRSFLPWILFVVISTRGDWRHAAMVALAVALWLLRAQRGAGRSWDAMVIEVSASVFFAAIALFAWAAPESPLRVYASALAVGWLALTAWVSLIAGRPFTLGIARQVTSRDVQETPLFRHINTVVTTVWAIGFTLTAAAVALVLQAAPEAMVAVIAVKIVGFAGPAIFTRWYPAAARARQASNLI
jgi:hypothetical protein